MDNREFLEFLFRGLPDEQAPLLCSFRTDPLRMGRWSAYPWRPSVGWDERDNNFVTLSSFTPMPDGRYKCKAPHFAELRFIMLDDVREPESLGLRPTYCVETSPGNHQVGYALERAPELSDRHNAGHMLTELGRALGNLGAVNVTRWARLPVGTNTKAMYGEGGFRHRLVWFEPVRHSWQSVLLSQGVSIAGVSSRVKPAAFVNNQLAYVVPALKRFGLYKRELGEGRHAIVCPNLDEHTNRAQGQSDTVFFEPSADNFGRGGLKCLHSHCEHVDLTLLLAVIDALEQLPKSSIEIDEHGKARESEAS